MNAKQFQAYKGILSNGELFLLQHITLNLLVDFKLAIVLILSSSKPRTKLQITKKRRVHVRRSDYSSSKAKSLLVQSTRPKKL